MSMTDHRVSAAILPGDGRPRRVTRHCPPASRALLLLACLALGGCGYGTGGLYPDDVQTVAVPVFANATAYSEFEFLLTEALKKQIEAKTPYKVTGSAAADTILSGRIVRVDQRLLGRQVRAGLPQELEVSVTLDFEWKNQLTGQSIRQRRGFTRVGRYVVAAPVAEPLAAGLAQAADRVAEAIVAAMSLDWQH